MNNNIETVADLIAALNHYDAATPVRCATQPGYPLEHTLTHIAYAPADGDGDDTPPISPQAVWLGASEPIGYVPAIAVDALGWSQ